MNAKPKAREKIFEGLGVSPGIAIGRAHLRESGDLNIPEYSVPEDRVEEERERFHGEKAPPATGDEPAGPVSGVIGPFASM